MVAQTVTGTRTSSLENPTTVLLRVILVPRMEPLPLCVPSTGLVQYSSFPISRTIRCCSLVRLVTAASFTFPGRSTIFSLLCC